MLGFTPVLLVLFFGLRQNSIRNRMKEKLESPFLQTITLNNDAIQWAKPEKEIWVNGKMFDIKSKKEKDGKTTFKGLYDDEETLLKTNLRESWEKNKAQQNHLLGQIFQSLSNIYFTNISWSSPPFNFKIKDYPFYISQLEYHYSDILTPPPQA
jgi:hypothetical protein